MRDIIINAYLDYLNNYLTIATWAEHNGLTEEQGIKFIELAREIAYTNNPDA